MPGQWQGAERARLDRLPTDWRATTRRVLARDGGVCRIQHPDRCIGTATEVDHIVENDDHSDGNLRAACTPCHRQKTAAHANRVRWSHGRRQPEKHPGLI
ncbi:MAG: HNH endonuclease [Streptosporangiales bacterium]